MPPPPRNSDRRSGPTPPEAAASRECRKPRLSLDALVSLGALPEGSAERTHVRDLWMERTLPVLRAWTAIHLSRSDWNDQDREDALQQSALELGQRLVDGRLFRSGPPRVPLLWVCWRNLLADWSAGERRHRSARGSQSARPAPQPPDAEASGAAAALDARRRLALLSRLPRGWRGAFSGPVRLLAWGLEHQPGEIVRGDVEAAVGTSGRRRGRQTEQPGATRDEALGVTRVASELWTLVLEARTRWEGEAPSRAQRRREVAFVLRGPPEVTELELWSPAALRAGLGWLDQQRRRARVELRAASRPARPSHADACTLDREDVP